MPENPITVPLPQDLPTNWVYGQTIGPNGTDVGLTQQYGYNYLMQQVNAAQQAAEELGEGISGLSGDNIPETAGSETSISTALSNKADKGSPQRYALPLANGWVRVNAAEYWRTQENIVIVTFRIAREGGAEIQSGNLHIATLPEGFRALNYQAHTVGSTVTPVKPATIWTDVNGFIWASSAENIPSNGSMEPYEWAGFAATLVFVSES